MSSQAYVDMTTGQEELRMLWGLRTLDKSQETCRHGGVSSIYPCDPDHKALFKRTEAHIVLNALQPHIPLTKQGKRPCHHQLARQVLQGQYFASVDLRGLCSWLAQSGNIAQSVLSQPKGRGWKCRGQQAMLWSLP